MITTVLRIYAEPFVYNTGCCRFLEKAGLQYEGSFVSLLMMTIKVMRMSVGMPAGELSLKMFCCLSMI